MEQTLEIVVVFRDKATAQTQKLTSQTTKLAGAYKTAGKASKDFSASQAMMQKNMQKSTRGSANMTMALQSMNFTIRDSPYFFRDFSLGILAVGNNLNPMIDSIIAVKKEMGGWKGALRAFTKQMMGPSGIIMAFSLLVTGIQAVTFAMAKSKSEAGELKSAFDGLTDFDSISKQKVFKFNYDSTKTTIDAIDKAIKDMRSSQLDAATENLFMGDPVMKAREDMIKSGKLDFDLDERIKFYKELKRINEEIIRNKEKEIEKEKELLEKFEIKKKEYESELEYYNRLLQYSDPINKKEKEKRETKEKAYILTNAELDAQIAKLEVLKSQTNLLREQNLYQLQIDKLVSDKFQFAEWGLDLTGETPQNQESFFALGEPMLLGWHSKTKEVEKSMAGINSLANTLGTTIWNAFSQGKFAADEFLKSLLSIAAQMVVIEGLKSIFSGGSYSMFSFLSQGGVVKASGGYITGGNGSHDYIPAMLRPKEMVLNPNQQAELFHMAKGIGSDVRKDGGVVVILEGTLDGQEFIKKTVRKNNSLLR